MIAFEAAFKFGPEWKVNLNFLPPVYFPYLYLAVFICVVVGNLLFSFELTNLARRPDLQLVSWYLNYAFKSGLTRDFIPSLILLQADPSLRFQTWMRTDLLTLRQAWMSFARIVTSNLSWTNFMTCSVRVFFKLLV